MGIANEDQLFRINLKGDTLWTKSISGTIGTSIRRNIDGTFIIVGSTAANICVATKTDSVGNVQWEFPYPGIGREEVYDLEILPDNRGYLISGTSDSARNGYFKGLIRIIDLNGGLKLQKYFTPSFYPTDHAEFRSGVPTSDGGFLLSGFIYPFFPGITYMVKTDSLGNIKPVGISNNEIQISESFVLHQNYPNPFNPSTNIKFDLFENSFVELIIYDNLGKIVATLLNQKINSGQHSIAWGGKNLSSGIYYCKIIVHSLKTSSTISKTRSMIFLK